MKNRFGRVLVMVSMAGAIAVSQGCGLTNNCTPENHCSIVNGETTCDDGYRWEEPSSETNFRCVKKKRSGSSAETQTDDETQPETQTDDETQPETQPEIRCNDEPMSQGLSQPCCPSHGIDACGAGLFCAAFDGRTQATCYAERSRFDQTECGEDRHCLSGSCNLDVGKCMSTPGTTCSKDVGCAPDPAGNSWMCDMVGEKVCVMKGDGGVGGRCEIDSDCDSGICSPTTLMCQSALGGWCENYYGVRDCAEGSCEYCNYSNVRCLDSTHESECLMWCSDNDGWGGGYSAVSCE